jgi:hypothetical protein
VRTTTLSCEDLITRPKQGPKKSQWNTTDSEVAGSAAPSHPITRRSRTSRRHRVHRWIEAKANEVGERMSIPMSLLGVIFMAILVAPALLRVMGGNS